MPSVRGDAPLHVETVGTAVESRERFVVAGFWRQHPDHTRRHVRRIAQNDIEGAAERFGERFEEVAREDAVGTEAQVVARARGGDRVEVARPHLDRTASPVDASVHRCAERARAAAQVEHSWSVILTRWQCCDR